MVASDDGSCASSKNAVAFFAARAQASDRLLPKLRPLELSSTALEPRRARGQVGAEHRAVSSAAAAPPGYVRAAAPGRGARPNF